MNGWELSKNDFLLYLYDNNEDEQGNLVARKVRQWMSLKLLLHMN